jgi:molecular chaperone Hsp33
MTDALVHALAFDDKVRIITATTSDLVRQAVTIHDCGPSAAAALGRMLTGALLMSATHKNLTRLTVQIQGGGSAGMVLARSDASGQVYGTIANPHAEAGFNEDGRLNVAGIVGTEGTLQVVRDLGFGAPYVGNTEIVSGEIGDDLANYLAISEQIQSAFGVGEVMGPDGVVGSGGFLIQLLGGLNEDETTELGVRLGELSSLSFHVESGASAEDLVALISPDARVLTRHEPRYFCPHDREYYRVRLLSLGEKAVNSLFGDDDRIEMRCEFTREVYQFRRDDIRYDS